MKWLVLSGTAKRGQLTDFGLVMAGPTLFRVFESGSRSVSVKTNSRIDARGNSQSKSRILRVGDLKNVRMLEP